MDVPVIARRIALPRPRQGRRAGLIADASGATAAEFALVVFPLFTLLLLVFEVGLTYWTGAALDNGIQNAMRSFYAEGTGAAAPPGSTADAIRRRICDVSGGLINCDKVKVDLTYYTAIGDVIVQSPVDPSKQDWRPGFGQPHGCADNSNVVVIQAAIAQQSFHSFVPGLAAFKDGSHLIQSATILQIEPKSAGLQGC